MKLARAIVSAFFIVQVAAVAASVALARPAPLSPLTVPAPPIASDTAAAAIFDAMIAIARAKATYPAGLEGAADFYNAALQRYEAGDQAGAQSDAIAAIAAATHQPYPQPYAWTSPSPTVATAPPMPAIVDTNQADAESELGVAWHALMTCGVTDPALLQALRGRYAAAVVENLDHRYSDVDADAGVIVGSCTPRVSVAPATPAPLPTTR